MQIIKADEVASKIKDNDSVIVSGFIGAGVCEELLYNIQQSYLETSSPKNIELLFCAGMGDGDTKGLNHLGEEGLIKRAIGGHFGLTPRLTKLINEEKMEGYNLPQGIMSHLIRASAAKKPYIVSKVGLNTFVDPRLDGGCLNAISKKKLVDLTQEDGVEYLKFYTFKPNVALIRGTYCDKKGNISFDHEVLTTECLAIAQAVRNHGGKIIVQVKKQVDYSFDPKLVVVPHILVDYVVLNTNEDMHKQTFATDYNENFVISKNEIETQEAAKLSERKIIARRAAMELSKEDKILNYGIGIPEMVANVLNEENLEEGFVPTVEPGVIGGTPQGGMDFGASKFPDMILSQAEQFDFYDGNGIDCAFLGLAQADENGNLNVSKFGPKIAGAGGFINISQSAKKVIFCGTFMAGAKFDVKDNKLIITKEGHTKKFITEVEQVTFSGKFAIDNNLYVRYITERAVFEIDSKTGKLSLIEIAPGVDLEKDVLDLMEFKPLVSPNLKVMDESIFNEGCMNLVL